MARGTEIIVSSNPRGVFMEGTISGTPTPGVLMEQTTAAIGPGGRFTWQVAQRADGAKGPVAVLLPDSFQGQIAVGTAAYSGGPPAPGTAYVSGTRCFLYFPVAGEELNLVFQNQSGTGDDIAVADLLGVDSGTGKLLKNNSFGSAPFQSLETVADPTADYMLWVRYLGNQA